MTLDAWIDLVTNLNDEYGIMFGVGEDGIRFPTNENELEDAWFWCPECQEPIYFRDWGDTAIDQCPICGDIW